MLTSGIGQADTAVEAAVSAIGQPLDGPRRQARLSVDELWVRYFGNGGTATMAQFQAFLGEDRWPGTLQYDIAVSALNDRFTEMDLDHPIPYAVQD